MRLSCRLTVLAAVLFILPSPLAADEGMWMPQQIPQLAAKLKAMGFTGDARAFADLTGHPMGAIVSLGGCSASFVSPDGLIATNHHCVQGSLQYNSKADRNLMELGFLARKPSEELWNGPGSRVMVTVSVKDVTAEIMGNIDPKTADRARYDLIEKRVKERTAACEKDGLRCTVASFFEGLKWFELAQMEIQDVRLVYAPAAGIGNFGGETDNWQWPRHTGDFSFYRAYVSPAGKAVTFSKDNVPFRPKHWLRVSPKGASPGELVFVAGYPGRTSRLVPYADVRETVEWNLPRTVRRNTDQIAILEKLSEEDSETKIRVSTRLRGLNNVLTKTKGVLEGMNRGGLLAQREANQKALVSWIDTDAKRQLSWGDVVPALEALAAERVKTRERDALLTELFAAAGPLGSAQTLYRLSLEKPKKDADRDPAFQERNWSRTREAQDRLQRSLEPKADRALLKYTLASVAKLPAGQRIEPLDVEIGLAPGLGDVEAGAAIDAFVEKVVSGTKLYEKNFRLACLDKSTADLMATNDAAIRIAAVLHPLTEANREKVKERDGAMERLGPRYAEALLAQGGGLVSPDANSTLRVTYGKVLGVEPRDGLAYLPQTTLQGVVEKATGKGEFNAPKAQLDAIKALRAGKKTPYLDPKLKDVPVDFLSTVDITNGNSGSATLNAKGELVGLAFDGTYETVGSDYLFDPVKTRTIHVDSRDMLWTMSEVDQATELLSEVEGLPKSVEAPQPTR